MTQTEPMTVPGTEPEVAYELTVSEASEFVRLVDGFSSHPHGSGFMTRMFGWKLHILYRVEGLPVVRFPATGSEQPYTTLVVMHPDHFEPHGYHHGVGFDGDFHEPQPRYFLGRGNRLYKGTETHDARPMGETEVKELMEDLRSIRMRSVKANEESAE